MSFQVAKFYNDHCIPVIDTGKHYRPDWVNIDCPWCHMNGGLGINKFTGAVKCWGCGNHNQTEVIRAVLGCDWGAAKEINADYTTDRDTKRAIDAKGSAKGPHKTVCVYPTGTGQMETRHRAYLEQRGFNAEHLEEVWGLKGTSHLGVYKFRIIAPILFNGVMVSYQGRDITGKAELRYKACKQEDEVIEHQTLVYGLDLVKGGACVIVEGIADTWRLGPGGVSCFGIAFTLAQVNLIASRIKTAFILFDAEEEAQKQARALAVALSARGVEVEILDISDTPPEQLVDPEKGVDPGNMKQEFANQIMEEIGI